MGTYTNHSNVQRMLNRLSRQAGVMRLVVHSLRHTVASAMIRAAYDVVRVAKILGHRDPSITLRVYAHEFAERDNAEAQDAHRLYDLPGVPATAAAQPSPENAGRQRPQED